MHFRSSSHFGHDNEARNGRAGLYKANNKGKIGLTGAVRGSGVIITQGDPARLSSFIASTRAASTRGIVRKQLSNTFDSVSFPLSCYEKAEMMATYALVETDVVFYLIKGIEETVVMLI